MQRYPKTMERGEREKGRMGEEERERITKETRSLTYGRVLASLVLKSNWSRNRLSDHMLFTT